MDAKQLAGLKKVTQTPVVIHNLRDIINRKILINKMTAELLSMQIKYSKLARNFQACSIKDNMQKAELVNKLVSLYEKQLVEFDEFRQDECIDTYSELNSIHSELLPKIAKQMEELDDKMKDLCVKIDHLEQSIPSVQEGVQYEIKKKLSEQSCAQTYGNFGVLE